MSLPRHAAPSVAHVAATNYLASHRPAAPGAASTGCVRCGESWPCPRYRHAEAVLAGTSDQPAGQ